MLYVPSAADPNVMIRRTGGNSQEVGEPFTLDSYNEVSARLVPGETTGVVIFAGQSNIANFGDTLYTMTQTRCHMLNAMDGGVYDIKEPVLGCNGGLPGALGYPYASVSTRVVDKLRAAAWRQRVILANVGAGGTSSTQWASGDCRNRIRVIASRILAHSYTPTVIMWHQGEQNTAVSISASQTRDDIRAVKAAFVSEGISCPMIVCKVAYTSASSVGTAPYLAVRQGQTDALSNSLGIYAGPDTDVYGSTYRYGDLHWNALGLDAVSTVMKNSIIATVP